MLNHRCLLTAFLITCAFTSFAQQDSVYYYNYNGKPVAKPENAWYYRKIESVKANVSYFSDHFKDGTIAKGAFTGSVQSPQYTGTVISRYRDGSLYLKQQYEAGQLFRTWRYHPNGVLLEVLDQNRAGNFPAVLIMYEADSTGKANIVNGNGALTETDTLRSRDIKEHFTMQGPYENGFKQGVWKGSNDRGFQFEEVYSTGKLISGITTFNGKKYRYKHTVEYPSFKSGIDRFDRKILDNITNPSDTLSLCFIKPGHLAVSFIIDTEGSIKKLTGFKAHTYTKVDLPLVADLTVCTPAKLRGVPIDYVVVNSGDFFVQRNFNLTPDIYFKGLSLRH